MLSHHIDYIAMNYPPQHADDARPLALFLKQVFTEDNVRLFNFVRFKEGKSNPENTKSSLTKQNFIELHTHKETKIGDEVWKPYINYAESTHIEISLRAKHQAFVLDIDNPTLTWNDIPEEFRKCPYTMSRNKKLPHFYFFLNPEEIDTFKFKEKHKGLDNKNIKWDDNVSFKDFDCDFLVSHMWERKDCEVFNWDGEEMLPFISLHVLKQYIIKDQYKKLAEFAKHSIMQSIQLSIEEVEPTKEKIKKVVTAKKSNPVTIKPLETKDKFLELLFDVIKNEAGTNGSPIVGFGTWLSIAGILKGAGYDFKVLEDYTALYMPNEKTKLIWDGLRKISNPSIVYGLQNIAKKINPNGYKDWLIKHNQYLSLDVLDRGEHDVAHFVGKFLIETLVFSNERWFYYNKHTGLWGESKEPSSYITAFTQKMILEGQRCYIELIENQEDEDKSKSMNDRKKKFDMHYAQVCKSGYNSQMKKYLKTYLRDDDFVNQLDKAFYRIAFRNGTLDLKTMKFTEGMSREDYITKTIDCDWYDALESEVDEVRIILKKICNWNDTHLEYYLSTLGYAFTGDSSKEQKCWYLRGQTASNGKSIIFEVLTKIASIYVKSATRDVLDKNADLRKEINTWRNKLILWLNEVSTKSKDEDIIKALCDGTNYNYNQLYSVSSVSMPITAKLFLVSNHTIELKGGDNGIKRRVTIEQFNSQFKDEYAIDDFQNLRFKNDKYLKEKLEDRLKIPLLSLIFKYSQMYWLEKSLKAYPTEWDKATNEVMDDSDAFGAWFHENYEIGANFKTWNEDWKANIKTNENVKNLTAKEIKDNLARLRITCEYKSDKVIYEQLETEVWKDGGKVVELKSTRKKGWWFGFQHKSAVESKEDEQTDGEFS